VSQQIRLYNNNNQVLAAKAIKSIKTIKLVASLTVNNYRVELRLAHGFPRCCSTQYSVDEPVPVAKLGIVKHNIRSVGLLPEAILGAAQRSIP